MKENGRKQASKIENINNVNKKESINWYLKICLCKEALKFFGVRKRNSMIEIA